MSKVNLVMFFLVLNSFSVFAYIPENYVQKEEDWCDNDCYESDKDEKDEDDCEISFTISYRAVNVVDNNLDNPNLPRPNVNVFANQSQSSGLEELANIANMEELSL